MSPRFTRDEEATPVVSALPALEDALDGGNVAVLVAPPGAGKTTVVPLALLDAAWVADGKLIVLEPRRLAARAAAARMAATLGEGVGETVGYRVRLDSRVSRRTRIEVVTEGVFTRMILDDPALEGVAGVLFDEFHERSLECDLGLAFARDSQSVLRPDLRLLIMSATLDGARIAARLGGAPVIESRGRAYEVETRYLGRDPGAQIEFQMAAAIRRALASETGGILAFLPGQGEITRAIRRLEDDGLAPGVDVLPLYGALDLADQDRAIAPPAAGRRKVVVATAIAETSLTLSGIRLVIDSGLSRRAHWDAGSGMARLRTLRVSRAAADQRRGRAGRTAPGLCWRLWDEAETRALSAFDTPEILESDLSRLALDMARWGGGGEGLVFLDPPAPAALADARRLLRDLGALDAAGAPTAHGEAMARLPLPPRLAHMVLAGGRTGSAGRASLLAAVIAERGLGGRSTDIGRRVDALEREGGARGQAARTMAARWAALAGVAEDSSAIPDGVLIAAAFPERVAKARGKTGEFRLAGGRGAVLDPAEPLATAAWLAVAELAGGGERDRILLAAELDIADLRSAFPERFVTEDRLTATPGGGRRAERILRLGELIVETAALKTPGPALIARSLLEEVRRDGLGALSWGGETEAVRARIVFLGKGDDRWPAVSDEALLARLEDWLSPRLAGLSRLGDLKDADLAHALRDLAPPDLAGAMDRLAPPFWTSPAGTRHAIDYAAEGGPRVEVRVQALFGAASHPTLPGGVPLVLALLSPAQRPIQLTCDLPRFWAGSWAEVRKEMRGRYPKHPWPENPLAAPPTVRAKPRT